MTFFIGSYTRLGGPGVAQCRLEGDRMTLAASYPLPNATYVILNRREDRLFAVSSDPVTASEGGSVASFDLAGGGLRLISRQDTLGADPCHLCLDAEERFLYTANYLTGSVSAFPVDGEGRIGPCFAHIRHQGRSVHPTRQAGSHAHQVTFLPGTRLLCAVDLGLDALMVYRQAADTGGLTLAERFDLPGGCGPRHLLHEGELSYLVCELSNEIAVLRRDGGRFTLLRKRSTLPDGWMQGGAAAAVRRAPDGRLLVSNRGHNSLAAFESDERDLLRWVGCFPTGADFPRDFACLRDGRLLIGHQNGPLRLAKWAKGGLETVCDLEVKGCVCVALPR